MKLFRENIERFLNTVEGMSTLQKRLTWHLADAFMFILATLVGYYFFINIIQLSLSFYLVFTLLAFIIYYFLSSYTHLNSRIKRYVSFGDIIRLFFVVVISSVASNIITSLIFQVRSIRFMTMAALVAAVAIISLRFIWQSLYRTKFIKDDGATDSSKHNVVLIGAGDGGSLFMSSYMRNSGDHRVVAILDDNPVKWKTNIHGVKVIGGMDKLENLSQRYQNLRAVIAIPSLNPENYRKILYQCNQLGIKVYKMPKVEDVLLGIQGDQAGIRKVEITDLLGRSEVQLDESFLRQEIQGKVILITGAGGSIGSEIARQVTQLNPEKVLLLGHGENSIYHIYHELIDKADNLIQFVPIIADVQDYNRLIEIAESYQPDIVYHAAAHKHVPLMEANPQEAFKNNIIGTYNLARAVDQTKVKKMVMISTDKAVRPPNVMGASKRIAELIVTGFGRISESTFCAVRFGNVLGSRGSVIPAFEKMIASGGPVKVTDFRMIRYFMTIPEASKLVIHAGAYADNGEVFILDMGEPVKILDLARNMILLSGYSEEEIGIVESGIRPGEKLYEELITSPENVARKLDDKVFVSKVEEVPLEDLERFIEEVSLIQNDRQILKETIIKFANESAQTK